MTSFAFLDYSAGVDEITKQIATYKGEDASNASTQELNELFNSNKFDQVAQKLIEQVNLIVEKGKDKDVEGIIVITTSLILSKVPTANSEQLLNDLASATISSNDKATLRVKLIGGILNAVTSQTLHFNILIKLLKFVQANGLVEFAVKYVPVIDSLLDTWKYDAQQRREVLGLLAAILKAAGKSNEFQKVTLLYLSSVTADGADVELVANAVADTIRMPGSFHFDDIAELEPVAKTLKSSAQYSKLYDLLTVLSKPSVADYTQFYQANASVLQTFNLTNEDVLFKVRVMSLCRLLSESSETIGYAAIATTLDISEDEVDQWVIRLVGLKLAQVRLDQYTRTVTVHSASQCVFGSDQWETLGARLAQWKHNVAGLLQTIKTSKQKQQQQQ